VFDRSRQSQDRRDFKNLLHMTNYAQLGTLPVFDLNTIRPCIERGDASKIARWLRDRDGIYITDQAVGNYLKGPNGSQYADQIRAYASEIIRERAERHYKTLRKVGFDLALAAA
jgi:hypothetical protein